MDELARNALIFGGAALLSGAAFLSSRWRSAWLVGVAMLTVAAALTLGVALPSDALHLADYAGLQHHVALLLAWGVFASLVPAAGRPRMPRGVPPFALAVGAGALLGELGAAAVLAAAATSRAGAARLALCASGGAMLGRFGDPALLVMSDHLGLSAWTLLPVGLLCAMVAWPMRGDIETEDPPTAALDPETCPPRSWGVTGIGVAVGLTAQAPSLALPALGVGVLALAALAIRRPKAARPGVFAGVAATCVVVLLAVAAGGPAYLAEGLESWQNTHAHLIPATLFGGAWAVGTVLDSAGAGLLSVSLLDRSLGLQVEGAALALAAGSGVAGFGPLLIAGVVREGWKILVAQGLIAAFVVLLVL